MKTVLITGGSRGIGKAIIKVFEENNYEVIAPSRDELDLFNIQSVHDFFKNSNKNFDVVINNAGVNEINSIEDITYEEIDKTLTVNLVAPILLLKFNIEKMKQSRYGRIVNVGSIWAEVSKEGRGIYSASKNGLHGITNTLALELAPFNILVNTVCPGYTLTELTAKNNSAEEIKKITEKIPLKRMAQPSEIAEAIYFLASEKNTYLTGQKIIVDGGYTIQ